MKQLLAILILFSSCSHTLYMRDNHGHRRTVLVTAKGDTIYLKQKPIKR